MINLGYKTPESGRIAEKYLMGGLHMFENIGSKLKKLAKVVTVGGIIISLISGIVLMATGQAIAGIIQMIVGCLGSWLASWSIYAIGDTHEMMQKLVYLYEWDRPAAQKLSSSPLRESEISCPNCSKKYDSSYKSCPHCGARKRV
jgi:hypothetical protein